MPGPSGDLEEWQTLEVNVTLGFASGDIDLLGLPFAKGDIDLEGLPFLKVTLEPRHYLYIKTLYMSPVRGSDLCVPCWYLL